MYVNPNCLLCLNFEFNTGIRAWVQSVPSYPLLLPRLARPRCSTICHLSPRLPEAGPQEPSYIRAPPPGPLQRRGRAYGYVHRTGCHAPAHPGGESGERVRVCAGTTGETMSYGADYGELEWWNFSSTNMNNYAIIGSYTVHIIIIIVCVHAM